MNRMSITLRITLWYSLFMLAVVLLMLAFMLGISDTIIQSNAQNQLTTIIDYNVEEVDHDDGEVEVDDDFDFLKNGVSSLVYSSDFAWIAGQLPQGFPEETEFVDGETRQVSSAGEQYLVYDRKVTFKKHPEVWVRGVLPLDAVSGIAGTLLQIAMIALPFLAILAAGGGYLITKRAFRPVRLITRTVDSITEGKDLSRRVDMDSGRDEIHALAATFNSMLQRLESSFETERQFVSDVSHELRTPVSVILAQCEYSLGQGAPEGEAQESLQVIERQARRMHRLIAHLLTITRMEQANFQAALSETNLSELLESLMEEANATAPDGVLLRLDIPQGIHARVDSALFARVVENLVQNAFKYGGSHVDVSLKAENETVALRVSDNGIGISTEDQPKIWRRFYQANPSRTAGEAESMGLGLAIVKQIAHLHHGEITLRSAPGEGSTFIFTFPQG